MCIDDELLRQIVDEREAYTTRIDAIEAVRVTRDSSAVQALAKAIESAEVHVRRKAVEALGDFKDDPRATQALMKALQDSDEGVRRNVIRVLAGIQDQNVVSLLRKASNDPSPLVRQAAQEALATYPPRVFTEAPQEKPTPRPQTAEPPHVAEAPPMASQSEPSSPSTAEMVRTPAPPSEVPLSAGAAEPLSPRITIPALVEGEFETMLRAWRTINCWQAVELGAGAVLCLYMLAAFVWLWLQASAYVGSESVQLNHWSEKSESWIVIGIAALLGWLALSFVGVAVTKFVAQRMMGDAPMTMRSLCRFALKRWMPAFLLPVPCVLALTAFYAMNGLLNLAATHGYFGTVLIALFYPIKLGLSAGVVGIILYMSMGGLFWLPCLVIQESNLRDALSTAFLFVFRKPWASLLYTGATVLRGALVVALVWAVVALAGVRFAGGPLALLTLEKLRIAWQEPYSAQFMSDFLVGLVHGAIMLAVGGYVLALCFAGGVGAYLALRDQMDRKIPR